MKFATSTAAAVLLSLVAGDAAANVITTTSVVVETVNVVKTVWVSPIQGAHTKAAPPAAPSVSVQPNKHSGHRSPGRMRRPHNQPKVAATPPAPAPSPPAPTPQPKKAPQPAPAPAPAPKPKPAPAPAPQPKGPSGVRYHGDLTWYDVGLGSCGETSTPSENVVAIPWQQMNNPANPNSNPLCGRTVTIWYKGVSETATVVDTCGGCQPGDLDLSSGLFQKFASLGEGRLHGAMWSLTG